MRTKINLCGIEFDNLILTEAVNKVDEFIQEGKGAFIVTPNVDHIVHFNKNGELREVYHGADLTLADGMPIVWASKLLNRPLKARVTGADLVPELFELADQKEYRVFILGSEEGVARRLLDQRSLTSRMIADCYSPPYGFENDPVENNRIIELINAFKPDLLLVSVGAPKGEKWIYYNRRLLVDCVAIQVGAAIDFMAGTKKRAPRWMQMAGLEWLFRFVQEPGRLFRRYFIVDSQFIWILMKAWVMRNKINRNAL